MIDLEALRRHAAYLRRSGRVNLAEALETVLAAAVGEAHVHRCPCGSTWDEPCGPAECELSDEQLDALRTLVDAYVDNLPVPDVSDSIAPHPSSLVRFLPSVAGELLHRRLRAQQFGGPK